MSNFAFIKPEWPDLFEAATKAEEFAHKDARASCFYSRRTLELAVHWMYKHDPALKLPYQDHLSALIHEPTFKKTTGEAVFAKARIVKELGNLAVHSHKVVRQFDAITATRELFHFCYWFARTYAQQAKPPESLAFNPALLVPSAAATTTPAATPDKLKELESKLKEKDDKLTELLGTKSQLDAELIKLRTEVAAAKKANAASPDQHDYSEAETRDYFIDLLLLESGWPLDQSRDREFKVTGMPNTPGEGYVDYVLWGDDGKPLGLIEAKRTKKSPQAGEQQAKLYADCLEKQFSQRPVIFLSNGYEQWIWDDTAYPPRRVQGFYKKAELELVIQRRTSKKPLASEQINEEIVGRHYQLRAIRRIAETFETEGSRKALVVMATGAGKTRTVIALCDLLMRCNWVKRVLFLADRVALVGQAEKAFKKHLPAAAPVNLVTEKDKEGRIFVSTYPTMMGLIDETKNGQRRFGPGHFDLVIIDEAHRSVYQKYRAIFEYFDSLLVGLTATPRAEIDHDTYGLFDLERGVPTDAYDLQDAVNDKYLVPAKSVSVPLKFPREGIKYDDLSEEEKDQWDALEWDEESAPDRVEAEAVNKWLFNKDTVDKVLERLMVRGLKVAGGDRLGKTIIFAKNQAHAEFIAERFNLNYPHYKGEFARIITFKTEYTETLIADFSIKDKSPHIAISVDMLDTGIDVPEVVNLVFFKLVRSKTKFWQMVGRGTRLCPDLFGPGLHKQFFYIFDFCGNLEFFSENPDATEGSLALSLSARLFKARLEMLSELDRKLSGVVEEAGKESHLRRDIAELLRTEVAAMNVNNFIVRPRRRLVEKYSKSEPWKELKLEAFAELDHQLAGLPSELEPEEEEAKRFDLLILNLQLSVLRTEPSFERLRDQVIEIAGLLEEKATIPMVKEQMPLIQDIQSEEWWTNVTTPMLEVVRKRLRALIKFIEKQKRKPVYTNFIDEIGQEAQVVLPGFAGLQTFEKFRDKARAFLRDHQDHISIRKLRLNEPLTASDLAELERILKQSGVGGPEEIEKAKAEHHGLGRFVRSLVGLDREAAKKALSTFTAARNLSANQIEFVDLIVDYLTEHGVMDAALLYESPFTDFAATGPAALFPPDQVQTLISLLTQVNSRAVA